VPSIYPDKITRPAWAEIDLDCLAHNVREVRRITEPGTRIMAAVKADAYGHGAPISSRTLLENGAERLAVAALSEALELRREGIEAPILVLGYTPENQSGELLGHGVTPTVYTRRMAEALSREASEGGEVAKVHIKVDTGMGRLGFPSSDEGIDAIEQISRLPGVEIEGVFTHFAAADERDKTYTRSQFEKYMRMVNDLERRGVDVPMKHVSNSAAVIDLPEYNLDMVRPGIMLYGLYPSEEVDTSRVDLRPAMTLKARISHVKTVPAGTAMGYGLTYKTSRESVIGTIPLGYADGYGRALSNRGRVGVKGGRAPVVGRVCMDQFMVDLTGVDAEAGDEVILFGDGREGSPHIEEVARWLGTITHEVLCGVSRRVPRVYIKDGEVVCVKDPLTSQDP